MFCYTCLHHSKLNDDNDDDDAVVSRHTVPSLIVRLCPISMRAIDMRGRRRKGRNGERWLFAKHAHIRYSVEHRRGASYRNGNDAGTLWAAAVVVSKEYALVEYDILTEQRKSNLQDWTYIEENSRYFDGIDWLFYFPTCFFHTLYTRNCVYSTYSTFFLSFLSILPWSCRLSPRSSSPPFLHALGGMPHRAPPRVHPPHAYRYD